MKDLFVLDRLPEFSAPTYDIYGADVIETMTASGGIYRPKGKTVTLEFRDLIDADVARLLSVACDGAKEEKDSQKKSFAAALCSPGFYRIFNKAHSYLLKKLSEARLVPLPFIPDNTLFLIPSPELFGVIADGGERGRGIFCIASSIVRVTI